MLDLVETRERENKWWASGIILCVCVCVCVCTLSCVRMSACTCIWFVSRNTSSGTLRCKSAQEGKCVYSGTDACSPRCFQAPWMTSPPPLSSHSGRSWEELNSYRHTNLKAQKSDKMWQAPELLPFSASPFLSHSCFRSPLVQKKKSLQQTSFYNLGESLTTAITHDKVFN